MIPTPQQKAKELVETYQAVLETPLTRGMGFYDAKECAKMAVKEMLLVVDDAMLFKQSKREYYQQVLTEIDNIK